MKKELVCPSQEGMFHTYAVCRAGTLSFPLVGGD